MMNAIAVTDLHGNELLYELLLRIVDSWKIASVFIMGDLTPTSHTPTTRSEATDDTTRHQGEFLSKTFIPLFEAFLNSHRHTHIYALMGNDDRRANEPLLEDFNDTVPNFHHMTDRLVEFQNSKQMRAFFPDDVPHLSVAGYPYVPVGGGLLMDWVKHEDAVGLLPPGMNPCMDLESWGIRTVPNRTPTTLEEDLADFSSYLTKQGRSTKVEYDAARTIHLFHAPPYNTPLDKIPPQGQYDFVNLPDHVGSSAIRRFIERVQPHLVLSGHCHEAVSLADYKTDLGTTRCVNPGSQTHLDVLSVVQFDPFNPIEMKQFYVNAHRA